MKKSEKQQRFLFLTSEAATLQVTPVYRYTSTLNSTLSIRLLTGRLMNHKIKRIMLYDGS